MAKFSIISREDPRNIKNPSDVTIPADTSFTGDIDTKAGIRINGRIKGDVTALGDVVIGSYGSIDGSLTGSAVSISGIVTGDVEATGVLHMFAGSRIDGDIQALGIVIEEGAHFKGKCTIADTGSATVQSNTKSVPYEAEKEQSNKTKTDG